MSGGVSYALVGVLLAEGLAAPRSATVNKTNIVILFVDDLGYNEISLGKYSPPVSKRTHSLACCVVGWVV